MSIQNSYSSHEKGIDSVIGPDIWTLTEITEVDLLLLMNLMIIPYNKSSLSHGVFYFYSLFSEFSSYNVYNLNFFGWIPSLCVIFGMGKYSISDNLQIYRSNALDLCFIIKNSSTNINHFSMGDYLVVNHIHGWSFHTYFPRLFFKTINLTEDP